MPPTITYDADNALTRFELSGADIGISSSLSEYDHDMMLVLIKHGKLSLQDVRTSIRNRLNVIGRRCFVQLRPARGTWPDHVTSPQALAFVIRYGELTEAEIATIGFDHNDDKYSFVQKMKPELLVDQVLDQLLPGAKTAAAEARSPTQRETAGSFIMSA